MKRSVKEAMPIYEYTCRKCGAHVEVMQKISDKPLARHARCGGRLEKEWSRTGFQFKGSGWYVTDYAGKKSDAKEEREGSEGDEEPKPSATTSKSEARPSPKESAKAPAKSRRRRRRTRRPGGD